MIELKILWKFEIIDYILGNVGYCNVFYTSRKKNHFYLRILQ